VGDAALVALPAPGGMMIAARWEAAAAPRGPRTGSTQKRISVRGRVAALAAPRRPS